jgi:magnesium-transporting ATPase (P-type)
MWTDLPAVADLQPAYLTTLVDAIAANSRAELSMEVAGAGSMPEIIGNKTEGAMLLYLRALGIDYRVERTRVEKVRTFPFTSAKKRMSTVLRASSGNALGRLYTKGSPETLLDTCGWYMAEDGSAQVHFWRGWGLCIMEPFTVPGS